MGRNKVLIDEYELQRLLHHLYKTMHIHTYMNTGRDDLLELLSFTVDGIDSVSKLYPMFEKDYQGIRHIEHKDVFSKFMTDVIQYGDENLKNRLLVPIHYPVNQCSNYTDDFSDKTLSEQIYDSVAKIDTNGTCRSCSKDRNEANIKKEDFVNVLTSEIYPFAECTLQKINEDNGSGFKIEIDVTGAASTLRIQNISLSLGMKNILFSVMSETKMRKLFLRLSQKSIFNEIPCERASLILNYTKKKGVVFGAVETLKKRGYLPLVESDDSIIDDLNASTPVVNTLLKFNNMIGKCCSPLHFLDIKDIFEHKDSELLLESFEAIKSPWPTQFVGVTDAGLQSVVDEVHADGIEDRTHELLFKKQSESRSEEIRFEFSIDKLRFWKW